VKKEKKAVPVTVRPKKPYTFQKKEKKKKKKKRKKRRKTASSRYQQERRSPLQTLTKLDWKERGKKKKGTGGKGVDFVVERGEFNETGKKKGKEGGKKAFRTGKPEKKGHCFLSRPGGGLKKGSTRGKPLIAPRGKVGLKGEEGGR